MNNWIDFKELRSKLDFEAVLRHYKVEVRRKGDQHHGFCPLPSHQGKKNSPSFSANLKRGIFQCFGCGAKGNVLEFAGMMQKVDVTDGRALRDIALELQRRFCPELGRADEKRQSKAENSAPEPANTGPIVVNAPLDFELKGLDPDHPYLRGRDFSLETIAHFGLGFCSRGLLKDRVAIPLHDQKGRLIGYAGRVINDAAVCEENPRYRFPSKREREGKTLEFRKTRFLYNGFRIKAPAQNLVVVEGFPSADLIAASVNPGGRVWVMPDGDESGERFAESLLPKVSPHCFVRWVKLEAGKQPTDLPEEVLKARLAL